MRISSKCYVTVVVWLLMATILRADEYDVNYSVSAPTIVSGQQSGYESGVWDNSSAPILNQMGHLGETYIPFGNDRAFELDANRQIGYYKTGDGQPPIFKDSTGNVPLSIPTYLFAFLLLVYTMFLSYRAWNKSKTK